MSFRETTTNHACWPSRIVYIQFHLLTSLLPPVKNSFFFLRFFFPHKRNLFIAKTKKGRFDFFRKGWRREEGESGRGQIEKKKKEKQSRRNWLQSAGQNELFGSMVFLVYWFPLLTPLPRLWWSNSGWNKNERKSRNFIRFLNAAVGF